MKKRALLSVFDKTGIVEFAKELVKLNYEIISTGGTLKTLNENKIPVISISEITGFPECLGGRVKTLDPHIFAGILAKREDKEHMKQIKELDVNTIDIVAVNLYPFKQTISNPEVTREEAIENIDIGGPSMLRASAKNYKDVAVIIDTKDYEKVIKELKENKTISIESKFYLAYKVFEYTAHYDALIANYFRTQNKLKNYPDIFTVTYEKLQDLRYGENPHQNAIYYKESLPTAGALVDAVQLHGKELSFNNINDANGALSLLKEFSEPAVVAVKHANPCGVGTADNIYSAYKKAYDADPVSIFGGIVAANRKIDEKTAKELNKIFLEIVIAPSFSKEALEILKQKQNIRLLTLEGISKKINQTEIDMKKVLGGLLVQEVDKKIYNESDLKCVTKRKPTKKETEQLLFAWKVVKYTKSNGIVLVKNNATTGIGPGQTNRITALNLAIKYAQEKTKGSVMASDAFFPFSDCVEAAHKAGITAIIQPGGSIKDKDSIEKCNKYGIAMLFTGMRHFKH